MSNTLHPATTSTDQGALWWVGRVLAWMVILAISALVLVAVLIPRVGGATPYAVLTGSMRPSLPPGTLVVVRPVDVDDIGIGTVITYQLRSGEPTVVTHRVVGVAVNGLGEKEFRTQGDANPVPDLQAVRPVQIKGQLWYDVPHVGHLNGALNGSERQALMLTVATGLLGYAGFMFASAWRGRRHAGERS